MTASSVRCRFYQAARDGGRGRRTVQRALALPPTEAAMLYAKAFAVGVVTGVLAPVVVAVASFLVFVLSTFSGGFSVSGAGGIAGGSISFLIDTSPKPILIQMAVGFAIGFLFTLWRAMVKSEGRRSG